MAFRSRAISRLVALRSFLVSFNSSFKGFTMFSISTRVAFSVLSIRTVSASASAFSASAFAFRTVDFIVMTAITVATRPPPSTRFINSLSSIPFYYFDVTALFLFRAAISAHQKTGNLFPGSVHGVPQCVSEGSGDGSPAHSVSTPHAGLPSACPWDSFGCRSHPRTRCDGLRCCSPLLRWSLPMGLPVHPHCSSPIAPRARRDEKGRCSLPASSHALQVGERYAIGVFQPSLPHAPQGLPCSGLQDTLSAYSSSSGFGFCS
ncbi:hypothetical protein PIN17_A0881 [Prevotella intermedia 17]|nr:hypothetical protein PIN17_A0881 [Prevotella intermedia 17]